MRTPTIGFLAASLIGCSSPSERAHRAIMDRIEAQVQLPKGAARLAHYSRYYAEDGKGNVAAVYLNVPNEEHRPGERCDQLDSNLAGHPVPCQRMQIPWAIPAGQRKWVKNKEDLPLIDDGGCMEVNVTYDKARSIVTTVECNGDG